MRVFEEFEGPWGVPDVVALVADERALASRIRSGVDPLLRERDCRVLAAVGRRWVASESLVGLAGASPRAAHRRLRGLVERGALDRDQRGRVRLAVGIAPVGRVWALEAKVDAWRAGLAQAQRYRLWADGAVLVLGRQTVADEVLRAHARDVRVGVWAAGTWVVRPRLAPPDAARRLWTSEHAVAALFGYSRKPGAGSVDGGGR